MHYQATMDGSQQHAEQQCRGQTFSSHRISPLTVGGVGNGSNPNPGSGGSGGWTAPAIIAAARALAARIVQRIELVTADLG